LIELQKQRWLFLSNSPRIHGGLQKRTYELALAVLELGGEVLFVCYDKNPFEQLKIKYPQNVEFCDPPEVSLRSLVIRDIIKVIFFMYYKKPDVVFYCNTGMPDFFPFVVATRFFRRIKIIVHHGTEIEPPPKIKSTKHFGGIVPGFGFWRIKLILSIIYTYKLIHIYLFNNSEQMDSWIEFTKIKKSRCFLWYPPVDLDKFSFSQYYRKEIRKDLGISNEFIIGCVGCLCPQKQFDTPIRSLKKLLQEQLDCKLVIVGSGESESYLRKLVLELNIQDDVIFLGDRDDVHKLMSSFDVLVMSSSEKNETLGIVILEAMAARVPVIVSELPGALRLVKENNAGLVFKIGDVNELTSRIKKIFSSDEKKKYFIKNGIAVVRRCERKKVLHDLLLKINSCS
jgi:glycosyltransferase involved in cell wall biosynthesis